MGIPKVTCLIARAIWVFMLQLSALQLGNFYYPLSKFSLQKIYSPKSPSYKVVFDYIRYLEVYGTNGLLRSIVQCWWARLYIILKFRYIDLLSSSEIKYDLQNQKYNIFHVIHVKFQERYK